MGLRALIGMFAPIRLTGAIYLRKGLEHIRSEAPPLPNEFYDEFVGAVIGICELQGLRGLPLKSAVISRLDMDMLILAALLDGERSATGDDYAFYLTMLRKHGALP